MRLVLIFFLLIYHFSAFTEQDSLYQSIAIASEASKFQAARLKVASENLSNESTTGTKPGEDPYRRKVVFARNKYNPKVKANTLQIERYDFDPSPFMFKYEPNHPAADAEGYVKLPNVRKEIEKVDIMEAKVNYEANLSVMETAKSLIDATLDMMR